MIRLKIILTGKIREKYLQAGAQEYIKRLTPYAKTKLIELQDEPLHNRESERSLESMREVEAARIRKALSSGDYLVAMDVGGVGFSSTEFSKWLHERTLRGVSQIAFVIGGTTGLSDSILKAASLRMSLGPMTFPHQIMPMLLLEQIYRGMKIQKGERYHR